MSDISLDFQVIPLTTAPSQRVSVTLGTQNCVIDIFTKSINVPVWQPGEIDTDLPVYENANPVFLNLFVNDFLIIGGVLCLSGVRIVRDSYLGFIGDLAFVDTIGGEDPRGTPMRLPPMDLRNWWQRQMPLTLDGKLAPADNPNTIPGLGTRFVLTYWPNL